MELGGKERSVPGELSRGMRQKLALACGLLHDPAALIFDEPLTGLDPLGIRHIKQMIVARAAEGAAVVVSSHLLHLVEEICTRIVIIAGGLKVADGTLAGSCLGPASRRGRPRGDLHARHGGRVGARGPVVTGALVYLTACSFRNRVIRRFRRLKEPRYLAGAVVGSLYIYFAFLRAQWRAMRATPRAALAATLGRVSTWAESGGALALWLFVVLRWAVPSARPALQFSGPEVQFLFTAPVPRRRLLHYKLLRGQIGLLFTALVALLIGGRAAPSRLSFVLGSLPAPLDAEAAPGGRRAQPCQPDGARRAKARRVRGCLSA